MKYTKRDLEHVVRVLASCAVAGAGFDETTFRAILHGRAASDPFGPLLPEQYGKHFSNPAWQFAAQYAIDDIEGYRARRAASVQS